MGNLRLFGLFDTTTDGKGEIQAFVCLSIVGTYARAAHHKVIDEAVGCGATGKSL
jgi:hypothetical protein